MRRSGDDRQRVAAVFLGNEGVGILRLYTTTWHTLGRGFPFNV
jgi:hypothetical protein